MLEKSLKWASIASLASLVVLLAVQLTPRFIERAQANALQEHSEEMAEPIDFDSDVTASPKLFMDPNSREASEDKPNDRVDKLVARHLEAKKSRETWNKRLMGGSEAVEKRGEPHPENWRTRRDQKPRSSRVPLPASTLENVRQRRQLVESLREGATRDFERNYDEQPGDLAERHDGDRFDVVRGDLPERHEALLPERMAPRTVARRYDSQDSDLATRHQALPDPQPFARLNADKLGPHIDWFADRYGDNEKEAADADVQRYYLVPVPRD